MSLKSIFRLYIQSSLHVSMAVMALSYISSYYLRIPTKTRLHTFIFLGTVISYNLIKYTKNMPKPIKYISFICSIGGLSIIPFLNISSLIIIGGIGVVCLLYIIPALPNKKSLRYSGGLIKILSVAISWGVITVILPFVEVFSWKIEFAFWLLFFKISLFIFILMIPFEIRDAETDDASTLSQSIRIKKLKIIGFALLIIFLILDKIDIPTLIVTCLTTTAIALSKKEQSYYFSSFFVESIPIFWWALILFL